MSARQGHVISVYTYRRADGVHVVHSIGRCRRRELRSASRKALMMNLNPSFENTTNSGCGYTGAGKGLWSKARSCYDVRHEIVGASFRIEHSTFHRRCIVRGKILQYEKADEKLRLMSSMSTRGQRSSGVAKRRPRRQKKSKSLSMKKTKLAQGQIAR